MNNTALSMEELKHRAKAGDLQALQELRQRGFFQKKIPGSQGFPVSHAQQRLWILSQIGGDAAAYNIPEAIRLEGCLQTSVLRKSLLSLIARHEILRTTFTTLNGETRQIVHDRIPFALNELDLRSRPQPENAALLYVRRESQTPFDLQKGPLLRADLLRLSEDQFILFFNIHHILCDEWSLGILMRELAQLYEAFCEGQPDPLPPLRFQYKDYAARQQQLQQSKGIESHRKYWRQKLAGEIPALNLPCDFPRPAVQSFQGKSVTIHLGSMRSESIRRLSRQQGASLFAVLAAWLKILLYRYTGEQDIILGAPTTGRDRSELADQIGFYVHTLALRDHLQGNDSFCKTLQNVQQTLAEALAHQAYPFDRLVDELSLERDLSHSPLFNVMISLQNLPEEKFRLGPLRCSEFEAGYTAAKFDLTFQFTEIHDELLLGITYCTALFRETTVRHMADHLFQLMESILKNPNASIQQLDWFSTKERHQILTQFNKTSREYPHDRTLPSLFEEWVKRKPENRAVVCNDTIWTYRNLNEYANGIAWYLRNETRIQPEECIAVLLDHHEWVPAVLLGILKAGGAYLPIDPAAPPSRIEYMLRDAHCRLLLSETKWMSMLSPIENITIADVRSLAQRIEENPIPVSSAQSLAYVMYTSGSTGMPKGVEIIHRGIIRLVVNTNYISIQETDCLLQTGSLAFDASTYTIWGALLNGASICFTDFEILLNPEFLRQWIMRWHINVLFLTSRLFNQLADMDITLFHGVRHLTTGGEKASPVHCNRVLDAHPGIELFNAYGPTENTTYTTMHQVTHPYEGDIPIGKPIANTTVLILDQNGNLLPIGVPGEICIGGAGLARGYLGRPALTAEKFIPDPSGKGERLYRTGDLGRWLPDGSIEFLGRMDHQIKLRGFRIEIGEIENHLLDLEGIREAVVLMDAFDGDEPQLAAYVIARSSMDSKSIRNQLKTRLPEYMIPAYVVILDHFPLNQNGKIDRKALPNPLQEKPGIDDAFISPHNELEENLAEIWRDVLRRERVGIHDSFFDLGGNSLRAIQISIRIHKDLNAKIGLKELFQYPTIAELAEQIRVMERTRFVPIDPIPPAETYPVSHAQKRLWVIDRMGANRSAYNITEANWLEGDVDEEIIRRSLQSLVERHESLRTTFLEVEDEPYQKIHSALAFDLNTIDFRQEKNPEKIAVQWVNEKSEVPFDLEQGPLFRATLLRITDTRSIFVCTLHHIISDGWSMEVLIQELLHFYHAFSSGTAPKLSPLRIQYKDFSAWQRNLLDSPQAKIPRDYWLQQFSGEISPLEFPADRLRPAVQSFRGATHSFRLNQEITKGLRQLGKQNNASLFMVFLSLLKTLLYRYTGQPTGIVGTPASGRDHPDLANQIGFYVNMLALRSELDSDNEFLSVLHQVRNGLAEAYAHQIYPFDRLVEELDLPRDMGRNPLFDVVASIQEVKPADTLLDGIRVSPFAATSQTSKFDLTFFFTEMENDSMGVGIEYNTDLFFPDRIERMASHFMELARSVQQNPHCTIGELSILPVGERERVLEKFNAMRSPYPSNQTIVALFEDRTMLAPEHIAVRCENRSITYRVLNQRANQVARMLRDLYSVQPEERVAVLMERSETTIIALLGILKAGGAYVPIDPSYPDQRKAFILGDAGCRIVLTEKKYRDALQNVHPDRNILLVSEADDHDSSNLPGIGNGSSLAYIIYTSGSTGEPKGSLIEQRAVVRLVLNTNYIRLTPDDRILQLGSLAFDASTFEIWGALLNGGCVCLPAGETVLEPERLHALIKQHNITTLFLTTSLFNQFVEADTRMFASLKTLLTGGEKVSARHMNTVRRACPNLNLLHVYGPTENTTFSTYYPVTGDHEQDIPIGFPIANSAVYILDSSGHPAPIGVPGEICVAGDGVARGYLNHPEWTAQKFRDDPFQPESRLYRTGDRGCWRSDGAVLFQGRIDDQVKVRGFRVEPGEIEIHLRSHLSIREAMVTARKTRVGTHELAAYYTSSEALPVSELREYLSKSLPGYMIPSTFTWLEQLPLTINGKVDKRKLPAPEVGFRESENTGQAPRTKAESLLVSVWQSVLGHNRISVQDNYFELGGDSIRAIQIVSRLKRQGVKLEVRDLFQYPTIAQLALILKQEEKQGIEQEIVQGPVPQTPIQQWYFESHPKYRHHFNQSVLLRYKQSISEQYLRDVLSALQNHHDALRMIYRQIENKIEQTNAGIENPFELEVLTCNTAEELEIHAEHVQRSFDLERGPLWKTVLFRLPDGDRLFLVIHHLIVDGVSWRILLEDIARAYHQREEGRSIDLDSKTASFKQWSDRLQDFATHPGFVQEREYWEALQKLPAASIPVDFNAGGNRFGDCQTAHVCLGQEQTQSLLTVVHRAYHTEINDLLLTALGRALKRWSGQETFWINMEGHGREALGSELDVSRTVGWFTSVYPFYLQIREEDLANQIKWVKESLRQVPRKGTGFGILRYLSTPEIRARLQATPAPSISFNYLGQFDKASDNGEFTFSNEPSGNNIHPQQTRQYELDFVGMVLDGKMQISLLYNPNRHREETAHALLKNVQQELVQIVDHCRNKKVEEKTPSDFSSRVFSLNEYPAFLRKQDWRAEEIEDIYLLSPMQEGLLFQSLLQPEARAYHVQVSYRLRGSFRQDHFELAWKEIVQRHAILRSAFIQEGLPRPVQVVLKNRNPEFQFMDIREISESGQNTQLAEYKTRDHQRGFDFQREPLMRFAIFCLSEDRWQIVWSYHHILLDGWCLGILYDEFNQIYAALQQGEKINLPSVRPYSEFIRWLDHQDREQARKEWRSIVECHEQRISPPFLHREVAPIDYDLQEEVLVFDPEISQSMRELASRQQVTLNTVIQTAWAILLARCNDAEDVLFGAVVSGRPPSLSGAEEMVGLFINAIPVRIRLRAGMALTDVLQELQDHALRSEPFHYYPLAEIQALAGGGEDLFDHLLIFANYPQERDVIQGTRWTNDWVVESVEAYDQTHYDFNGIIVPGDSLQVKFHFNANRFTRKDVRRIAAYLHRVILQIMTDIHQTVDHISILPPEEYQQVVYDFNQTKIMHETEETVLDFFLEQVKTHPEDSAVRFQNVTLSYRELNRHANQVANFLLDHFSMQADARVGIFLERSEWVPAVVLGVLKSGAGYVPIDPALPQERITHILQDSECFIILTEEKFITKLSGLTKTQSVNIRQLAKTRESEPEKMPSPSHLAYIIYTSGSTGNPKGCLLEHRNLVHYLRWAMRYYFSTGGGWMALHSSLSIDMTVTSLFLPLLMGRTLYIYPQDAPINEVLLDMFRDGSPFDCVKLTPSHIEVLKETGITSTQVRLAIVGGEALLLDQVRFLHRLNPAMRVINEYGPTETTVGCVVKEIHASDETVLIGRPIDHTQIYILDHYFNPVPVGVLGELYIGGAGVARGYYRRDDLNAERFLPNPFRPGERIYKTGDIGRWMPDGEIDYVGRNDGQVKIRGYRVELSEIERHLLTHAAVRKATVIAREFQKGNLELAAYYVADGNRDAAEFRAYLKQFLPEYMLPRYFVPIEDLPLSPSGKVDHKMLPDPSREEEARAGTHQIPRGQWEEQLAAIWREVLQVETIGRDDDFFALGGHSLKAMQMASRIQKTFDVKIGLREIFDLPTVRELAPCVRSADTSRHSEIGPAPQKDDYELSYAQKRLWLLHHMEAAVAYNMPKAFLFEEALDTSALKKAFTAVVSRHESLRTAFVVVDGEPRQMIVPYLDFSIQEIDLRQEKDPETRAREIAGQDANTPFDLTRPPLLRASLIRLEENRYVFLLTIHHIIGDGWSMTVLYQEILALYGAFHRGDKNPLVSLRIQYKDFSEWQNSAGFEREEQYWLPQLAGAPKRIALPSDFPAQTLHTFHGNIEQHPIQGELLDALRTLAVQKKTTLSNVVLALFYLLLYQLTRQNDLCIGMSMANRNHPDLENLIGFFVNILPIRLRLTDSMEFDDLLNEVIDTVHEAFDHQNYPFDLLVQKINPERVSSQQPIVNVIYAFQNFGDVHIDIPPMHTTDIQEDEALTHLRPFEISFETSKFDLTLFVFDADDSLSLTFEYSTDLFHAETVRHMLLTFERFAAMVINFDSGEETAK